MACYRVKFTFTFTFTVTTKTAAASFVTYNRYLCEWLVRVALRVEVQNERDLVEIIRVLLCKAQYYFKPAAVCTFRSEGCTTFFHSHPRHFVNVFQTSCVGIISPSSFTDVLFLSTFLALCSFSLFSSSLLRTSLDVFSEGYIRLVIPGFRCDAHELCTLLGCYAA